jgi:Asp-tRNA(Asn)/Glu-tRNA(Gln) amidotransferase C subunit
MAWSKEERVRALAQLVGITIAPEEETEVADRFESLMRELAQLTALDLTAIEPVTIFPEEEADGQ